MSDGGQVSETEDMSKQGFAQDLPPGDDGAPSAAAAGHRAQGGPKEYGEGEGVMGDE